MYPGESVDFNDHVVAVLRGAGFFEPDQPVWIARAPGRLDFMGGNDDYTGGWVLQLPLRQAVWAAVQLTARPSIQVLNPGAAESGWKTALEMPIDSLSSLEAIEEICASSPGAAWGRYVLGGFHLLRERYGALNSEGANLYLASDLPPNRGLASSAALEVAALKAACAALEIALEGVALAEAAQWVENVVAHSACGIMDQAAVVLGRRNCLLPLVCQPCLPLPPVRLPERARVWGIDSMVARSTGSAAYERARAAAFMGYKMVCRWEGVEAVVDEASPIPRWTDGRWNGYLSNLPPSEFRSRYERRLPEWMEGGDFLREFGGHADPMTAIDSSTSYPVRAAVRYATEENHRVATVKLLLENMPHEGCEHGLRLIGEILSQSHFAYAECGLGAAACDDLVALAQRQGFFGAKMTGGGAGGVVAVLGHADQQDALNQMVAAYGAARGAPPRVFQGSSNGADLHGTHHIEAGELAERR